MIQAFKESKMAIGFLNLVAFLLWGSIAVFHTLSLVFIFRNSQKLKRGGLEIGNETKEMKHLEKQTKSKKKSKKEEPKAETEGDQGSYEDFYA